MKADIRHYTLTYILLAASSIVYLFSALFSQSLIDMNMQILVDMGALFGPLTVLKGEWWRLLTAMFLHGGMTHLLMNMFALYIVGRGAEVYFDTKSYISIYFFSGIIGGLVSLYIHPVSVGVGASGAIFGVVTAFAVLYPNVELMIIPIPVPIKAKYLIPGFIVLTFFLGLLNRSGDFIAHFAHLGGAIVGFIIIKFWKRNQFRQF